MSLKYYISSTYRRRAIVKLQQKYDYLFNGVVLDIGGRDRGKWDKPKDRVKQWIFTDIVSEHNPDMVLDVTDMHSIKSNSIDTIAAFELFEHVHNIELGVQECARVLKPKGYCVISMPFLMPIHGDPYDFQRWTHKKWLAVLTQNDLELEHFEVMGYYFTHIAELLRKGIKQLPFGLRHAGCCFFQLLTLLHY
jgi:SAM-dependent methyltransferase